MNRISAKLWLGEAADACDIEAIGRNGITAALSLAEDACHEERDGILRTGVFLSDLHENPLSQYRKAVETIDRLLKEGHTVLIHCTAGISRSPAVVAGYLTSRKEMHPLQAWCLIVRRRPVVEPNWVHFERTLEAIETTEESM